MKLIARGTLAAMTAFCLAGAAGAATVSEAEFGEFSNAFKTPTVIGTGPTTVSGVWTQGDADLLAFTGLRTGAQTVTLSFAPLTPIGPYDYGFSAGGTVNYMTTPFKWSAWEGKQLASVGIQHWNRGGVFDYVISLGDDFAGSLYLGLFGSYGTLGYTIRAEGNAAPFVAPAAPEVAAVPLPAAAPLLLAGLGALALAARRRRRS